MQLVEWQTTDPLRSQETAYLRLQLDGQVTALLPLNSAQEVLSVPITQITPMPNMPGCTLGLLNQRSRIFWVIDLSQLLEMPPLDLSLQQFNVVIIRVGKAALGLAVREVKGVIQIPVDDIQSPMGTVAPGLTLYLQGCVLQTAEILLVLDPQAIVQSPVLQVAELV